MLKIAIISDIHANLPALRSVLMDAENGKIDQIFCLGDLVDFAPWPNEVIDLIRQYRIPTLMGNHDERIAFDLPVIPLQKHNAAETEARIAAINWTKQVIRPDNKAFLATLPREFTLSFSLLNQVVNVLLVHASPRSIDEYIYETHDEQDIAAMMDSRNADVLVMGHTHQSYIRTLQQDARLTNTGFTKIAVNCGSVGRSKENRPEATYLLLTILSDSLTYELIHVSYPVAETIEGIRQSSIPEFYARFLELSLFDNLSTS
jgi:predicted phosphodiesterase